MSSVCLGIVFGVSRYRVWCRGGVRAGVMASGIRECRPCDLSLASVFFCVCARGCASGLSRSLWAAVVLLVTRARMSQRLQVGPESSGVIMIQKLFTNKDIFFEILSWLEIVDLFKINWLCQFMFHSKHLKVLVCVYLVLLVVCVHGVGRELIYFLFHGGRCQAMIFKKFKHNLKQCWVQNHGFDFELLSFNIDSPLNEPCVVLSGSMVLRALLRRPSDPVWCGDADIFCSQVHVLCLTGL